MIGSLILTRILYPEAFGIMATAQIIIVMIQLFTDIGIRTSIIQNPKGAEPDFLNTAWIICCFRGVVLSLMVILMSWPLAVYYNQPQIQGILLVMSLSPLILGLENPALSVTIKEFRVEKKVGLEIWSQALGLASSIILAWLMQSVYALAIGVVLSSAYKVVGSFLVTPLRPQLIYNKVYAAEILHFGKYIFINTLISFLAMNADILLIGKVLRMEDLGIYTVGRNIGTMIWIVCLQIFLQSYLPAVSSVNRDLPRVVRMYERSTALIMALVIPASIILALFSRDIIRLLYDPRYQNACISMFWFSVSGILLVMNAINSNTFIAMGRLKYETICMGISLVLVLVLVPLGAMHFGLSGAAAGMFAAIAMVAAAQTVFLSTGLGFPLSLALRPWYQLLSTSGVIVCMYYALRPVLTADALYNIPFLVILGMAGLASSFGIFYLLQGPHPFRDRSIPSLINKEQT
jgi:O-antigen/teichoic acid export membrane protein